MCQSSTRPAANVRKTDPESNQAFPWHPRRGWGNSANSTCQQWAADSERSELLQKMRLPVFTVTSVAARGADSVCEALLGNGEANPQVFYI
ncbi:MAG: hypothetical protein ACPIOQ_59055 [Promethearchaeia archaeon]